MLGSYKQFLAQNGRIFAPRFSGLSWLGRVQIKLSLLCCMMTALLVLAVVLFCLRISEKNMYGQEEALFFRKANDISYELKNEETVSINWYMRNASTEKTMLCLEVNGNLSALSDVALTEPERMAVEEVKEYIEENHILPMKGTFSSEMEYFSYGKGKQGFLVMYGAVSWQEPCITYLYLYSLKPFWHKARVQRIWFLAVWLLSIPAVFLFSWCFTGHVLKPVEQGHEKQKNFIAVASHELRSPLAVLKTGLSILKNIPDTEKSGRIFSLMDHEMSRMERLIQDLLCLVKMEQAELSLSFAYVELADLAENLCGKYSPMARDKGISFAFQKEEGNGCRCICDPQRIEQVMVILLDNAFFYTPAGQSVTLRLYQQRNKCCIQVMDTGAGIPDQQKEKIFDKFYQASPSRSNKDHFGLGLSIAKEICHSHGGTISVSDTKGGGSTFTVKLPVKR